MAETCSDQDFHNLIGYLWPLQACKEGGSTGSIKPVSCPKDDCPVEKTRRFATFRRFYERQWEVICSTARSNQFAHPQQQDLFDLVNQIKLNPEMTKLDLAKARNEPGMALN